MKSRRRRLRLSNRPRLEFDPRFMKLTNFEIQKEWINRRETRLGDLCGNGTPTPEQLEIAAKEADQWRADYQREQSGDLLL